MEELRIEKYPAYKDSGVEWLGEIPDHWEISRLKNHVEMITGFPFQSNKYTNKGIRLARGINVKEGTFNWDETRFWPTMEKELEKFLLKEGDILIGMDGSKVGKNFCIVEEKDLPILLLQRVARLRARNELTTAFLYSQICNKGFYNWVEMSKTDPMVPHIAPSDINNFIITLPPKKEQILIAAYLKNKTAQIEKAIAQKQKLIELLKERRQILIHNAVKRGLDPNVPMKDSGVEWIGEIPAHWEVLKYSRVIVSAELGGDFSSILADGSIPLIKMGNIGRGKVDLRKVEYLQKNQKVSESNLLKANDFLFNTRNSLDLVGKVCIWRNELSQATFNSNILRINFKKIIHNEFMNYLFNSKTMLELLKLIAKGTTNVSAIYYKDLSQINIALPPHREQLQISKYLNKANHKIDFAIAATKKEIEKLKEYKATLINAAVTGKIKVG